VHKETIAACAIWVEGGQKHKQVRRFATMTADLLALRDWLRGLGIGQVAMESTGVYWKPVWNVLEGEFELLLVNARHMRQVPGRKTDVKDCEWIADLLQHGLLRGSFVPEQEQRDLRERTRYRARLSDDRGRVASRVEKVLEDANSKLAAVATDVLGASGRAMLEAIVAGEQDAEKLAELAQRGLRKKLPELRAALQGVWASLIVFCSGNYWTSCATWMANWRRWNNGSRSRCALSRGPSPCGTRFRESTG